MKTRFGVAKQFKLQMLCAITLATLLTSACMHSSTQSTVGTHRVKVTRNGLTNRVGVESSERGEIFRYDGFGHMGRRLQVSIQNDVLSVNGETKGLLKAGDAVLISNDGIAVNSMDYGESARYLEKNARESQTRVAIQKSGN